MPAASGAKRQPQPSPVTVNKETVEAMLKNFQCEACGHYEVRRTERDAWYMCVHCGYGFGIKPYPKKYLHRAMDVGGTDSSSH
jgi:ribosomal protein L37AE/L43A